VWLANSAQSGGPEPCTSITEIVGPDVGIAAALFATAAQAERISGVIVGTGGRGRFLSNSASR
jgi:hypothetical protein